MTQTPPIIPLTRFNLLRSTLLFASLVACSSADPNGSTRSSSNDPGSSSDGVSSGSGQDNGSSGGAPSDANSDTDIGAGGTTTPSGGQSGSGGDSTGSGGDSSGSGGASATSGSAGCGRAASHNAGGENVQLRVSASGEDREFYLSLPANYDPDTPHALIFGYPGTSWTGAQIQPYLELESDKVAAADDEIFVYPTPLWRFFDGDTGGWALGPHGGQFGGNEDLQFTEELAAYMKAEYCIDESRLFATGHSWGGDMANVVACFTDLFRATAPIAANGPYWFHDGDTPIQCDTSTVVWNFYGLGDTWFNDGGQNGREVRDFWIQDRGCDGLESATDLGISSEECEEYQGCSSRVRSCLYGASFGHQSPDYFAEEAMAFFRSFD